MALFQELTGQGRVVGGHLSSGSVVIGGATQFSRNSDLSIQHASNPLLTDASVEDVGVMVGEDVVGV